MGRTINEAIEQEERKRNNDVPTLNVDHLDSDKRGSGDHDCCDSKTGRVGSQQLDCKH